jgi:type IV secretory pathway VirB3-like protein
VEGTVPLAIALIVGVVVLAAVLLGILWALIFLIPFYVYVGAAVYLVWRARRRESDLQASVRREAEQQRVLNEQEMRAWQGALGQNANRSDPSGLGQRVLQDGQFGGTKQMLTEKQIAVLRDIAIAGDVDDPGQNHQSLVELVASGHVERDWGTGGWFKITSKGQRALDERD